MYMLVGVAGHDRCLGKRYHVYPKSTPPPQNKHTHTHTHFIVDGKHAPRNETPPLYMLAHICGGN